MLKGRRIIVTGASSGIGRALVQGFSDAGALVLGVGRDGDRLEAVTSPQGATAVQADLTTEAGRRRVATAANHAWGAVDVVVHAAGALGPVNVPDAALAVYPEEAWNDVFKTNVTAVHLLHQRVVGLLENGVAPTVIGVSSSVGRQGRGLWGMYSVSKRALEGWLEVLTDEFQGRVFSVNPGGTATPMRAEAMPSEDQDTLPAPHDVAPLFLRLAHRNCAEPSGAKLEARDWIGRDPWEGLRTIGDHA